MNRKKIRFKFCILFYFLYTRAGTFYIFLLFIHFCTLSVFYVFNRIIKKNSCISKKQLYICFR